MDSIWFQTFMTNSIFNDIKPIKMYDLVLYMFLMICYTAGMTGLQYLLIKSSLEAQIVSSLLSFVLFVLTAIVGKDDRKTMQFLYSLAVAKMMVFVYIVGLEE